MESKRNQSYFVYVLLFIAIIAMVFMNVRQGTGTDDATLTINELARAVQDGDVNRIIVQEDNKVIAVYGTGEDEIEHGHDQKTEKC